MDFIVLSLGTNVGDRESNLDQARHLLEMRGVEIMKVSSLYETEPYGIADQDDFLNQVLLVHANQTADELLATCLGIEHEMGRVRAEKNGPRVIDIDLLFYKDLVLQKEHLTLPHKGIATRRFVLQPLAEIAGDQTHPSFEKIIQQLLDECTDSLIVKPYKKGSYGM
jgi:2-amino-4-hydroxy-6-hydroxymethyldihydropteridine diphosphokinase